MNICNKKKVEKEYIRGHLYSGTIIPVAIYQQHRNEMVDLKTGLTYDLSHSHNWTDVTDKYCLQEI